MKRKILVMLLALALCASLCACGSYRTDYGTNDYGTDSYGTTNNGMTGNGTVGNGTDMTPDMRDGYVGDNNADDGIVDGRLSSPSPNVTQKP